VSLAILQAEKLPERLTRYVARLERPQPRPLQRALESAVLRPVGNEYEATLAFRSSTATIAGGRVGDNESCRGPISYVGATVIRTLDVPRVALYRGPGKAAA
jgi:hypothetical protein